MNSDCDECDDRGGVLGLAAGVEKKEEVGPLDPPPAKRCAGLSTPLNVASGAGLKLRCICIGMGGNAAPAAFEVSTL